MLRRSIFFLCAALFACSSMMYAMETSSEESEILLERSCEQGSVKLVKTMFKDQPIFSLIDTDGSTKYLVWVFRHKDESHLISLGKCIDAGKIRDVLFNTHYDDDSIPYPFPYFNLETITGHLTDDYKRFHQNGIFEAFYKTKGFYAIHVHTKADNKDPRSFIDTPDISSAFSNLEQEKISYYFYEIISFLHAAITDDIGAMTTYLENDTERALRYLCGVACYCCKNQEMAERIKQHFNSFQAS